MLDKVRRANRLVTVPQILGSNASIKIVEVSRLAQVRISVSQREVIKNEVTMYVTSRTAPDRGNSGSLFMLASLQ